MNEGIKTIERDRIVTRLKDLGLSSYEALVYTTLLKHSSMTASMLCKETDIPDSKIYYVLDGLDKKGMLTMQKGNPSFYRSVAPKDALLNLKERLAQEFKEKTNEIEVLADLLTPVYESVEKSEQLEVAYIVRGQKNIINRMKALIETAHQEVAIFISYPGIIDELKESLVAAKDKRRVKIYIGVTKTVYEKSDFSGLKPVGLLCCSPDLPSLDTLGMLITDAKTLLTISNWIDETAMLTQDPNVIRVVRSYFDNPTWCTTPPDESSIPKRKSKSKK